MANSRFGLRTRLGQIQAITQGARAVDADAQLFFDATGITDETIKNSIQQLVVDLKGYGIWTKMKAIYPFVGGTASTHKWNLKDARDLNAAFRLVFSGGWTHSSTGALPNGTTGYADTFLIPSTELAQNNTHISAYSRTNIASTTGALIGNNDDAQPQLNIFPTFASQLYIRVNSASTSQIASNTSSIGLFQGNRVSSTETRNFQNTTLRTQSANSTGLSTKSVLFSLPGTTNYGSFEIAFGAIGQGLSDTEAANLYTAVQAFQTTLGRQV